VVEMNSKLLNLLVINNLKMILLIKKPVIFNGLPTNFFYFYPVF